MFEGLTLTQIANNLNSKGFTEDARKLQEVISHIEKYQCHTCQDVYPAEQLRIHRAAEKIKCPFKVGHWYAFKNNQFDYFLVKRIWTYPRSHGWTLFIGKESSHTASWYDNHSGNIETMNATDITILPSIMRQLNGYRTEHFDDEFEEIERPLWKGSK